MNRWGASLLVMALAPAIAPAIAPVMAMAQEPRIRFELASDTVVVGQPLELRILVLVPTWMPKPPDFPTLEVPSLMVRLPERGSGPTSERVDGETWSGVQRAYQLYPLAAGDYALPAGEVAITYADPGTTDPVGFSAPLPDIRFVATIPPEAAQLAAPVLAQGFTLEQDIDGEVGMTVGDAITRTVTARIEGTTPVLIPRLAAPTDDTALRAYPKDPAILESDTRGVLSGTRTEVTTYVAQADGALVLPGIAIDWFNLDTGDIETASVPAIPLTVAGAPAPPPDPAAIAKWLGLAAGLVIVAWALLRRFRPALTHRANALRQGWRASERYAHRRVRRAISRRDLSVVSAALDRWKSHARPLSDVDFAPLDRALATLGAARFGKGGPRDETECWRQLATAYATTRMRLRAGRRGRRGTMGLPPLNP